MENGEKESGVVELVVEVEVPSEVHESVLGQGEVGFGV